GLAPRTARLRALPAAAEGDQAEQAARRQVLGVGQHSPGQVLEPLGIQSMRLAPQRQLDLCLWVLPRLELQRLVRLQVVRPGGSIADLGDQETCENPGDMDHGSDPSSAVKNGNAFARSYAFAG